MKAFSWRTLVTPEILAPLKSDTRTWSCVVGKFEPGDSRQQLLVVGSEGGLVIGIDNKPRTVKLRSLTDIGWLERPVAWDRDRDGCDELVLSEASTARQFKGSKSECAVVDLTGQRTNLPAESFYTSLTVDFDGDGFRELVGLSTATVTATKVNVYGANGEVIGQIKLQAHEMGGLAVDIDGAGKEELCRVYLSDPRLLVAYDLEGRREVMQWRTIDPLSLPAFDARVTGAKGDDLISPHCYWSALERRIIDFHPKKPEWFELPNPIGLLTIPQSNQNVFVAMPIDATTPTPESHQVICFNLQGEEIHEEQLPAEPIDLITLNADGKFYTVAALVDRILIYP